MLNDCFSKDKINTGRQPELDLLKAYSIVMMIITHCIDVLYNPGYLEHFPSYLIEDVLSQTIGATSFMMCMGIGIIYSRHTSAEDFLKRGIGLLTVGQLLNLIRYGAVYGITYLILGDGDLRASAMLTFSGDVLQFAGLFFICMALFTRLGLKHWHIFLISVIVNIIGMPLRGVFNTGIYGIDQFIGLFIFNESESYFPLVQWMIFPAFGLWLGDFIVRLKDKKRFYGLMLIPTVTVWVIYYYVGLKVEQPFFTVFTDWITFCGMGIFDAIAILFCITSLLCAAYFINLILPESWKRPIGYLSRNINRFYCIHEVIVLCFEVIYLNLLEIEVTPMITYVTFLFVLMVTTVIVVVYDRYLDDRIYAATKKHTVVWFVLIIVITVAICIWSSIGTVQYPNLHNDYESIVLDE